MEPSKSSIEILQSDVIDMANELLNANEFHAQRMQTVKSEGGVAEVSSGPLGVRALQDSTDGG